MYTDLLIVIRDHIRRICDIFPETPRIFHESFSENFSEILCMQNLMKSSYMTVSGVGLSTAEHSQPTCEKRTNQSGRPGERDPNPWTLIKSS